MSSILSSLSASLPTSLPASLQISLPFTLPFSLPESLTAGSLPEIAGYAALLFASYKVIVYVQRIYFHPLSRFPGPKICAASRLYEFYWDSVRGGMLWQRLPKLHDTYGPIVRIGPNEVHIRDTDLFLSDRLFGFRALDKDAMSAKQFGMNHALFGTENYKIYTKKRAAFGDAFSRSKMLKLQDLIYQHLEKANKLMREASKKGEAVDLAFIYRATPAEIITEYLFGQEYGFLEDEAGTKGMYDKTFDTIFGLTNLGRFIPFWIPLLLIFSLQQLKKAVGLQAVGGAAYMDYYNQASKFVNKVSAEHKDPANAASKTNPSVFNNFLDSDLPEADKQGGPLTEQAMAIWSGGWETIGFTATLGTYAVLRDEQGHKRLREELREAWPDTNQVPSMATLDGLTYLNAVVKETLRLSYGANCRLKRVNPNAPEQYGDWSIPPGTRISMSIPEVHHDPKIWGEDHAIFRPERWIGQDHLDKYLMTFSKGTRVCPGIELAWIETKILFASMFRKFELKIQEEANVTDDDIYPFYEGFTPVTKSWNSRLPVYAKPVY